MATKQWVGIVLGCLALAGCASPLTAPTGGQGPRMLSGQRAKLDCDGSSARQCKIDVEVSVWTGTPSVGLGDLVLVRGRGSSKKIHWELPQGANVEFDPTIGIVFEPADPEFVDCKPAGPRKYACTNNHTKFGVYKYTINVIVGGGTPRSVDPWVVNE